MAEHVTKLLGTRGGQDYHLTIRVSPSFNHVTDFAVVVHRSPTDTAGREIQIARIDTAHGRTHFDSLYRRGQPKERIEVDVWEAAALLEANWRTYAESFDDLAREWRVDLSPKRPQIPCRTLLSSSQ